MPGAGFKRKALEWRRTLEATRDLPFEYTKGDMLKGTAPISFSSLALNDIDERADKGADNREYREMVARNVAATLYTAGADTVSMPPAFRGECTHEDTECEYVAHLASRAIALSRGHEARAR